MQKTIANNDSPPKTTILLNNLKNDFKNTLNETSRIIPTGFSFLRAIAIKLFKYRKKKVKITSDQWNYTGISLVGAFANSGSFGRGIVISPDAKIDDGILNISHIGNIGMLENVKYIIPLKKW